MKLLHTDTLEEAREKLAQATAGFPVKTKRLPCMQALGHICAEDVLACENIPPFARSTVDGYAVKAKETYGAGETNPAYFEIAGSVAIEKEAEIALHSHQAIAVQTGSMIPPDADAVMMVEYTEKYAANRLIACKSLSAGENIVRVGEDIRESECVIPKGKKISAGDCGICAALGICEIEVFESYSITVISTGDELCDPSEARTGSEIRDINTGVLSALALEAGFTITETLRLKDDYNCILEAVKKAAVQSDVVVLSGGSSKGEKDYTLDVIQEVSRNVLTHGIAIKPGKPTLLAADEKNHTVLAGLPGHPMAAALMFRLLIADWQRKRMHMAGDWKIPAVMEENVSSNQGRATVLPVVLRAREDGYTAVPVYAKSGCISALSGTDGFVYIERNREGLKKGEIVFVEVWR